jgi:hypothetical protein
MTLGGVLEILKRHGEDVPKIDTGRVVQPPSDPDPEV